MNIKRFLYNRSIPKLVSSMDGKGLRLNGKVVYLYMNKYSLLAGHTYFVSYGHITEGFWLKESTLLKRL